MYYLGDSYNPFVYFLFFQTIFCFSCLPLNLIFEQHLFGSKLIFSIQDFKSLNIKSLANYNSVLIMWYTDSFAKEAIELAKR